VSRPVFEEGRWTIERDEQGTPVRMLWDET
jgi:hypothetical protein